MVRFLAAEYDYLFNQIADPRVKDWVGFSDPRLVLAIIAVYLLSVYVLLPEFMRNRKPYSLKTFLFWYNIFQIAYCLTLVYVFADFSWGCQPVDYSSSPKALHTLTWIYYTYLLKGIEMTETAVFVLRKKYKQVSKLHVYHHVSTFLLAWTCIKYVGGGMVTFPIVMNCLIHIMMYTYYLLTSLGEEWQKKTVRWKSTMTMLQLVQFCVLIAHSLQTLNPQCDFPAEYLMLYLPDVVVVFYMFGEFYKENYSKKRES